MIELTEQERLLIINALKLANDDIWQRIIELLPPDLLTVTLKLAPISGRYDEVTPIALQIQGIIEKLTDTPDNGKVTDKEVQGAAV